MFDKFDVAVDLFGSAVDVDEQGGRGVGGIAGVGVFLQADDSGVVEPFQRGGHGPGLDDGGNGVARITRGGKAAHEAPRYRGNRAQRHGCLGEDRQRAFRTDEHAQQVGAVIVGA